MNTSGIVSTRFLPWKSRMVWPEMRSGVRASNWSSRSASPLSSAIAVVQALKVEPISNVPADMRFRRSFSSAATGRLGS